MSAGPTTQGERLRFNPFSAEFRDDPYAVYARLRAAEPVHKVMGIWVLTRYADIVAVTRERRFVSTVIPDLIKRYRPTGERADLRLIDSFIEKAIVFTENPDHARLRRLVSGSYNLAAINAERPRIERVVREQMSFVRSKAEIDGIADIADPIPLRVSCERLGIPPDMFQTVASWTHRVRFLLDPSMMRASDFEQVHATLTEFFQYLLGLLEARRRDPHDDLLSQLLAARNGDDRLTDEEILTVAVVSFVAGHETTRYLIGNGLKLLLEHPEQLEALRRDPGLLPSAVDEILRFEAPLQQTKRVAAEDLEIGGHLIRKGEQVLLCFGAGNRDPERFPDPDRFDIRRGDDGHLSFGRGMRACLGGPLAHLEAQITLGAFADLDVRATGGPLEWQDHSLILRGLRRYPILVRAGG